MKNKIIISLLISVAFSSLCEAQHARNEATFLGGETPHLRTKKNQVIAYDRIDFESTSKAECPTLLKYIENLEETLLTKEGKTERQLLDNQKLFYKIVLNLERKGGDYNFNSGAFNTSKPEQEYLLSHKIKALKLVTYAPLEYVTKVARAEAAFKLAELYTQNQLASDREIFNVFNIATIAAPESIWGAKSIKSQVTQIESHQLDSFELPLATLSRILNGIKQYSKTDTWKEAGVGSWEINSQKKAKVVRIHAKAAIKQAALRAGAQQRLIAVY